MQIRILIYMTIAGVLSVFATGCGGLAPRGQGNHFRVMTYNLHHGEGLDGKIDLERVAAVIQREKADIVALQEVDRGVTRTAGRDLGGELAKLTGMSCLFSNNFHFQGGEYGNALLTRFPVERWTNVHYRMLRPGEQRGLLQAVLKVQGREILVMNTHIDYRRDDAERLLNAQQIDEVIKTYAHMPVILCGDFNDTPGSQTYNTLSRILDDGWLLAGEGDGLTFSADKRVKRIDYLWLSKSRNFVPVKLWVPQTAASDHLPLVGEFGF